MEIKYQKIKIIKFNTPKDGEKFWVEVIFNNGTKWMPALIDLGDILSKIGKCEDMKYPNGKGYLYTKKFIEKCFNKYRSEIIKLYKDQFDPNSLLET